MLALSFFALFNGKTMIQISISYTTYNTINLSSLSWLNHVHPFKLAHLFQHTYSCVPQISANILGV